MSASSTPAATLTTTTTTTGNMTHPVNMSANSSSVSASRHELVKMSLENCILPESKFKITPSSMDGLDPESELDLRILGCELIQTSGILLKLPQVAMATGQVLFQRFYYSKSFVRYPMETTAMACILLASKIEEDPRRIRDVANVFHHLKQLRAGQDTKPFPLDQAYIDIKSDIIRSERRLLKELGFCVHVKHPHKFIVTLLQVLENQNNQRLMQTSWNYMNDSLRTDIFLRYPPETIACACVQLSANLLKIPLPKSPAWYEVFCVTSDEVRNICTTVLQLYARKKPDQTGLESIVEELRKEYENSKSRNRKTLDNGDETRNGIPSLVVTVDRDAKENSIERAQGKEDTPEKTVVSRSPRESREPRESVEKLRRSPYGEYPTKKPKLSSRTEIKSTVKKTKARYDDSSYYETSRRKSPQRHSYRSRSPSKDYEKERDRRSYHHNDYQSYHHHSRRHHNSAKSRNND